MKEYFYLFSGNIDPARDSDKINLDIIKSSEKDEPNILLFATASDGLNWHEDYKKNISNIFKKYNCQFEIIDNPNLDLEGKIKDSDIIYFLGGSPYKHTRLSRYREEFKKVPIKAGTSAGAIYLSYPTFYIQKDDYILAVPDMLGFVDLHFLPHAETHPEELVSNYLANEINVSYAKLYNQTCLKIEKESDKEEHYLINGNVPGSDEKIEILLKDKTFIRYNSDQKANIHLKLITY